MRVNEHTCDTCLYFRVGENEPYGRCANPKAMPIVEVLIPRTGLACAMGDGDYWESDKFEPWRERYTDEGV